MGKGDLLEFTHIGMIFSDEISDGERVSGDRKTSHESVGSFFDGNKYGMEGKIMLELKI